MFQDCIKPVKVEKPTKNRGVIRIDGLDSGINEVNVSDCLMIFSF